MRKIWNKYKIFLAAPLCLALMALLLRLLPLTEDAGESPNKVTNPLLLMADVYPTPEVQAQEEAFAYHEMENWAFYEAGKPGTAADVFFVCPTVYEGSESALRMPMADEESRLAFYQRVMQEKEMYDAETRFFAPYYEQLGSWAEGLSWAEREVQLLYACQDVKEAFLHYLETENEGRPIVLAGTSQGADMCLRLMKDVFADEALQEQLVACYVMDWAWNEEDLKNGSYLKLAGAAEDTGVIVPFDGEQEDAARKLKEDVAVRLTAWLAGNSQG